jgi:hypothetical protein
MPRINVGEISLNYKEQGRGAPILFIPGMMGVTVTVHLIHCCSHHGAQLINLVHCHRKSCHRKSGGPNALSSNASDHLGRVIR